MIKGREINSLYDLPFQIGEFVRQYLIDYDGTAAAIRAGYAKTTASVKANKFLKHPDVVKVIRQEQDVRMAQSMRGEKEVLEDIRAIGQEAREKGDLKSALRALELEGKHYCMFTDKVQNEVSGGLDIRWEE